MRDILRAGLRVLGLCVVVTLASYGGSGGGGVALPILPPTSPPPTSPPVTGELEIRTLSNRADMLSDGDAYVEIVLPKGADALDLAVDLDGRDLVAYGRIRNRVSLNNSSRRRR